MKSWKNNRPNGWTDLKLKRCRCPSKKCDTCSNTIDKCSYDFEAGADAILELLKAQGLSYENGTSMPRLAGFIYSRTTGKKGHIVFIED